MIQERNISARAQREAADWFTRLNETSIETEDLEAWSRWNRNPDNNAAYARLEKIALGMGRLRDDPDLQAATADALARGAQRRREAARRSPRRRIMVIGGLAAAGVIATIAGVRGFAPTYATGVGQSFTARLQDGTRVQLDTDSAVQVRFEGGRRKVVLMRGQAFFDVAHDAAHPFVVYAGDTRVRALGTRFEVRRTGDDVRVTLAQGSVEVTDRDAGASRWTLRPGQLLTVESSNAPASKPRDVDVASATSWTSGKITFQSVPLAEAVDEINRYNRDKIILAPGAPSTARVTGVFAAGDSADFVDAAVRVFDLKAERRSGGGVTLQPQDAPTS